MVPPTADAPLHPPSEPAGERGHRVRGAEVLALGGVALAFAVRLLPFRHIVEDAYISFRYAHHWAQGLGLVFNPGERVEGYSNFLWVILLGCARRLGGAIPAASQLLGFLFALGTLGVAYALARRWMMADGSPAALAFLAPLTAALWPPFSAWTLSGMETPLFAFFVTAAFYCYDGKGARADCMGPLALLGAVLTRPEGMFFAGFILVHDALRRTRASGRLRDALNRGNLWGFFIPVLIYYCWKFSYYGYLLPNSFYAKYGLASDHLSRGLGELRLFGLGSLGLVFLVASLMGMVFRAARTRAWMVVCILCFIACIAYMGGDIYPFSRYFVPVMPAAAALAAAATARLWSAAGSKALRFAAFGLTLALAWTIRPPGYAAELRNYEFLKNNDEERMLFVREAGFLFHEGDTIALQDAGIMPYYLGIGAVDMLGLNDETIAHLRVPREERGIFGHEKYDPEYILRRRPTFIFFALHQWRTDQVSLPGFSVPGVVPYARLFALIKLRFATLPSQTSLWELPRFKLGYTPFLTRYGDRMIILYRRDDAFFALGEHGPVNDASVLPLVDGFIEKGCFAEAADFFRRLRARGVISDAVTAAYKSRLERVPREALQEYDDMRSEAVAMHRKLVDDPARKGDVAAAWRALERASLAYPDSREIRRWREEYYRLGPLWKGPGPTTEQQPVASSQQSVVSSQ